MPPVKGRMFRYSEADMEAAIEECRRGVPTATAAKKFGVPRVTLLNKVKGKTPIRRKMGRNCYVTEDIEKILVTWAKAMVKQGFPIGKDNLQDSVKKIVDDLKIETPFKNGRPGKRWYNSFLKRHPDLITRQPQNLTASRASVTASQLKNWFQEVSTYLSSNNHTDILNEPKRVFNMDETAFFLNPKGNKVLAPKGERTVYQNINTDEKECFTVLIGGNAAGDVLPPMVIFKYERIPRELSLSVPSSWGIGRSDNGWMTRETFYEYICNIFHKWLDENNIPKPVILFIDGHTSHLSYHVSKFCSENGIILVALFPNATHLLQPMDVAVFRSLKGSWKAAVHSWRLENIDSPILRKINFCPLLNKVLTDTLAPSIFQNGFRKCGLVPWNPDEVCRIQTLSNQESTELTEIQKMARIKEMELGKKFLDKYIDNKKITKFLNCEVWMGPKEDEELFKFYKNVETYLKNLTNQTLHSEPECTSETEAIIPSLRQDSFINLRNPNLEPDSENTINEKFKTPVKITENISAHLEPETENTINENLITPVEITENIGADLEPEPENTINENFKTPVKITADSLIIPSTSHFSLSLSHNMGEIIPSPFKRALFWPTPKENSRKRTKEKIPSVISSTQWQLYYENKDRKKNEMEEKKKRRLEERREKKQKNEEERKLRAAQKVAKKSQKVVKKKSNKTDNCSDSSTEEEWIESGDSLDDLTDEHEIDNEDENLYAGEEVMEVKITPGDYVIINFPGKKKFHKFLCIIQKITGKDIEVMAMISCDKTKTIFKENEKDISVVSESQIVEVLNAPKMVVVGDRIKYRFDFPLNVSE